MLAREQPWSETGFGSEIESAVKEGQRLKIPKFTPRPMFLLMKQCWDGDPTVRPSWRNILEILVKYVTGRQHFGVLQNFARGTKVVITFRGWTFLFRFFHSFLMSQAKTQRSPNGTHVYYPKQKNANQETEKRTEKTKRLKTKILQK
jgi:hypothetical protein